MNIIDFGFAQLCRATQHTVQTGPTSVQLAPVSLRRVGLVIMPPTAGTITVSLENPAIPLEGWRLGTTDRPIVIDLDTYHRLVMEPFFVIGTVAGARVTVWSVRAADLT